MHTPSPRRGLLLYATIATPIAVLVFLFSARFFVAWDGQIVAMQPIGSSHPDAYETLLMAPGEPTRQVKLAADVVEGRGIPITNVLAPPPTIPSAAIHTRKSRFALYYLIDTRAGGHDIIPTTSPLSLALAVAVWVFGLMVRSVIVAGSPFAMVPGPKRTPRPLPTLDEIDERKARRSKKGPPPPRPRKGRGR